MTQHRDDTKGSGSDNSGMSRREFVSTVALAGAGLTIVPRRVLGKGFTPPSDLVNIAIVGIHGMGGTNAQAVMGQNIVAICDADEALLDAKLDSWLHPKPPQTAGGRGGNGRRGAAAPSGPVWKDFGPSRAQVEADAKWVQEPQAARMQQFLDEQLPKLKKYHDYREMLDQQKDLDAVIVATPDHMHAIIGSAAMDAGKHVYIQKPLCWSVAEARHLARKAAETKVVTQMGNQGHSLDAARRGQEYLMAGAIGDVREVHVWTNRPLGYWPQGVPRPSATTTVPDNLRWNNAGVEQLLAAAMGGDHPVPSTLHWDLFLGGAPEMPYHPIYHPFNWRGWTDWGQGAVGDMGAHLIDHPVWGLNLGWPTTVETVSNAIQSPDVCDRLDDALRVPGKRESAGRQADLVRRRPAAGASGRTG